MSIDLLKLSKSTAEVRHNGITAVVVIVDVEGDVVAVIIMVVVATLPYTRWWLELRQAVSTNLISLQFNYHQIPMLESLTLL